MAKILVVGSDPTERSVHALVVEFAGHECALASSVEEALEILNQGPFDLVVADCKRGGSAGDVVRRLKAASPDAAVLVLTESVDTVAETDAVLAGP